MIDNTCVNEVKENETKSSEKSIFEKLKRQVYTSPEITSNKYFVIDNESVFDKIGFFNQKVIEKSEEAYIEIVKVVVEKSGKNLDNLRNDKVALRKKFVNLFSFVLISQLIVLFAILITKGFFSWFYISSDIIITYMSTLFVETLGVIAMMITFAFKSSEEIRIIDILNSVVSNYQKPESHRREKAK